MARRRTHAGWRRPFEARRDTAKPEVERSGSSPHGPAEAGRYVPDLYVLLNPFRPFVTVNVPSV